MPNFVRRLLRLFGLRDRPWFQDDVERQEHEELVRSRLPEQKRVARAGAGRHPDADR